MVSEEHEQKEWDRSKVKPANVHRPDVREVIQSDVKVPIKDVTVWIDPLDATQEYTGKEYVNYWLLMKEIVIQSDEKAPIKEVTVDVNCYAGILRDIVCYYWLPMWEIIKSSLHRTDLQELF